MLILFLCWSLLLSNTFFCVPARFSLHSHSPQLYFCHLRAGFCSASSSSNALCFKNGSVEEMNFEISKGSDSLFSSSLSAFKALFFWASEGSDQGRYHTYQCVYFISDSSSYIKTILWILVRFRLTRRAVRQRLVSTSTLWNLFNHCWDE